MLPDLLGALLLALLFDLLGCLLTCVGVGAVDDGIIIFITPSLSVLLSSVHQ